MQAKEEKWKKKSTREKCSGYLEKKETEADK